MEALANMQCPRCRVDFKEHTPHGFIERYGGQLHDWQRCAEILTLHQRMFDRHYARNIKELGELLGLRNAQPWTFADIIAATKEMKTGIDRLHQVQPHSKEYNAGVEAACKAIENHSCVSTCCDAQPGGAEARELAACVRKNHLVST